MQYQYKGTAIDFNLVRGNIRGEVASYFPGTSEDSITDGLVKYDSNTNTVAVDSNASDSYAKYAAIHECICCGKYRKLAPKTKDVQKRCGLIDKMLIESMPSDEREDYIDKRIEMFETLLKLHLNPPLEGSFREAITILKMMKTIV